MFMKQSQTFKFDAKLIESLKSLAKLERRPFNNYVENELQIIVDNSKAKLKKVARIMNAL